MPTKKRKASAPKSSAGSKRQAADVAAVERAAQLSPAPAPAPAVRGRQRGGRSARGDDGVDGAKAGPSAPPGAPPTVAAVLAHPIMALAGEKWSAPPSNDATEAKAFDPALVERIFREEISLLARVSTLQEEGAGEEDGQPNIDPTGQHAARDALAMLELSSYLEHYLWPHYVGSNDPSEAHVLSIVLMVNAKCEAGMPAWSCFAARPKHFGHFVAAVLDAAATVADDRSEDEGVAARRVLLTLFLINAYQGLEQPMVRAHFLPLLSLPLWRRVTPSRVHAQLHKFPQLKRHWAHTGAVHKAAAAAADKAEAALAEAAKACASTSSSSSKKKGKKKGDGAATAATAAAQRAADAARALLQRREREGDFLFGQLRAFLELLDATPAVAPRPKRTSATAEAQALRARRMRLLYLERFAELLVDLLAQLPTRRYLLLLLLDSHVVTRCRAAPLLTALDGAVDQGDSVEELGGASGGGGSSGNTEEGALFRKLVSRLAFYLRFEIAEQTGSHTTARQVSVAHYERMLRAQRAAFAMAEGEAELEGGGSTLSAAERAALRRFSMSAVGRVSSAAQLRSAGGGNAAMKTAADGLGALSATTLRALCAELQLLPPLSEESSTVADGGGTCGDATAAWAASSLPQTRLLSLASEALCARPRIIDQINSLPLYPTETLLWDPDLLPLDSFGSKSGGAGSPAQGGGGAVLALPKLNLQFLTLTDYLLRNWTLYRLEAAHEIREDLVDAIDRVGGSSSGGGGGMSWAGWSRMALPIDSFDVTEVGPPRVGDTKPSKVHAELSFSLESWGRKGGGSAAMAARREWDELREHDVVFMVALAPPPVEHAAVRGKESAEEQKQKEQPPRAPRKTRQERDDDRQQFPLRRGVLSVRGAEVLELRDEAGRSMNDPASLAAARRGGGNGETVGAGSRRTLVLKLDEAQYAVDMASGIGGTLYDGAGQKQAAGGLNLLMRRRGKENNFRAVLQTIRDLMNAVEVKGALPGWLHDVFLGYGDPASASPACIAEAASSSDDDDGDDDGDGDGNDGGKGGTTSATATAAVELDFRDTFVSAEHVMASFPGQVRFAVEEAGGEGADGQQRPAAVRALRKGEAPPPPPYRLAFCREGQGGEKGVAEVRVTAYSLLHPGPFPQDQPRRNPVAFTPTQLVGIRAGMSTGLTLVVGPPGTGKTDVAVQVIANLYAAHPTQRIVLVTHSNQALNDLFAKLLQRDVDPRHMIRLGAGERQLREDLGEDFSKRGRVDYALTRRLELLAEVGRLARSLTNPPVSEMEWPADDDAATCEAADHFRLYHVQSRIERFEQQMASLAAAGADAGGAEAVAESFPFMHFFATATYPAPLFEAAAAAADSRAAALELARGCFRHLHRVFEELADCRAFELLRSQAQRADFLFTKQARIVAMTCTHAALARARLLALGFTYDTLVMEEAAQVLEIETFVPLALQRPDPTVPGGCRLKRVVLIGDHHQLPPVVKNPAFQKYGKLDQSLFARLVRLGVPTVQLDAQGRARPAIAKLYSWRYKNLGNLPAVTGVATKAVEANRDATVRAAEYRAPNAGFTHTFQFVDVGDFQGNGESAPTPHFFQNLGEAEFVVATFMYMRLLGYPAAKISILTTYNGQKHLIRDVLQHRCAPYAAFGLPECVTTVDRFQGQQNDFVLLSLVRTRSIGHLRDPRRLVVAMSRARLGLYVFGRKELFESCYELLPAFAQLLSRPVCLQLALGESWKPAKAEDAAPVERGPPPFEVRDATAMGVLVHQLVQAQQPAPAPAQ